jgi:hypothetical protein
MIAVNVVNVAAFGRHGVEHIKRVAILLTVAPNESEQQPPNPARVAQRFIGEVVSFISKPLNMANLGVAKLTKGLANALPSFPAARLCRDLILSRTQYRKLVSRLMLR